MTVLYFADTRFPIERANGAQTMATCQALAARGHDVTLVVRPDSAAAARDPFVFYGVPKTTGLAIEAVPISASRRASRVRFLLAAIARTSARPDAVIYTRDLGLAAFLLQLPSRRRSRLVYESHGVSPVVSEEMPRLLGKPELAPSRSKLRRLDRREARVWKRAAAYVTITRALAEDLTQRYGPREPLFVIPDGAPATDPNRVPSASSREGETRASAFSPVAAYAGHLYPWKGVDVLVEALALAPHIRGLIVGGHPSEADRARVEALIHDRGLQARVEITGLVPPSDVARHLARASILVLPNTASATSARYTSPLKLFEYLTLGLPIVASDLPAIREVLTHRRTALLVPAGDARALADAMEELVADRALAASLGAAALELAPEFTWGKRASRLEAVLAAASA